MDLSIFAQDRIYVEADACIDDMLAIEDDSFVAKDPDEIGLWSEAASAFGLDVKYVKKHLLLPSVYMTILEENLGSMKPLLGDRLLKGMISSLGSPESGEGVMAFLQDHYQNCFGVANVYRYLVGVCSDSGSPAVKYAHRWAYDLVFTDVDADACEQRLDKALHILSAPGLLDYFRRSELIPLEVKFILDTLSLQVDPHDFWQKAMEQKGSNGKSRLLKHFARCTGSRCYN